MLPAVTAQAQVTEIALRHVPMPNDDEVLAVEVLSVEQQIEKRKRAAEKAGTIIDVAEKVACF